MSLIDHPNSQPSLDISPIWIPVMTAKKKRKKYNSVQCRLSGKITVFMLVQYREFLSPVMTSIVIVLWCNASYLWSF
jgi:hypothetical protein